MRKGKLINRSIALVLLLVSLCCMIAVITSMFNLPKIPTEIHSQDSWKTEEMNKDGEKLGKFGELMIEMLPPDLAFTVFVPCDSAFEHILRLSSNHSFTPEDWDNTYATVSRVLGFSAVPRKIYSDSIPVENEISFDSISGFGLYISKDSDGSALVVNGVWSKMVDIRKGEVVVHIMDGVIMDSEFENSVQVDDHDNNEEDRESEGWVSF